MKTVEEHKDKDHYGKVSHHSSHDHYYVVMSFKSIGINTYNVMVFDLENNKIKYWHESYQLWES